MTITQSTLKAIGGWVLGIFFLLAAMGAFMEGAYGAGVLWAVIPLLSIPQAYHNVFQDFGMWLRVILVIALWISGSAIV